MRHATHRNAPSGDGGRAGEAEEEGAGARGNSRPAKCGVGINGTNSCVWRAALSVAVSARLHATTSAVGDGPFFCALFVEDHGVTRAHAHTQVLKGHGAPVHATAWAAWAHSVSLFFSCAAPVCRRAPRLRSRAVWPVPAPPRRQCAGRRCGCSCTSSSSLCNEPPSSALRPPRATASERRVARIIQTKVDAQRAQKHTPHPTSRSQPRADNAPRRAHGRRGGVLVVAARYVYATTLPVDGSMRRPCTRPVVGSVPCGRRKRRMCGSGRWMA